MIRLPVVTWLLERWRRRRRQPTREARAPRGPPIFVPEAVLGETVRLLRTFGGSQKPHEGIVYWAGVEGRRAWSVTTCLVPDARTTPGSYETSVMANAQIIGWLAERGLNLLAQVHTHPGRSVDHSDGDLAGAFMAFPGSLSVVVPNYGRNGMLPFWSCGIHRYGPAGYRRLSREEIETEIRLIPILADLRSKG